MESSEDEAQKAEDVIFLNILDEESPLEDVTLELLKAYILAFFGIPIRTVQTGRTPVSPPGVLALSEKTNRPLKQRNPRLAEHKGKSTRVSHLFECLREQTEKGGGIGPFPEAVGVLGLISGELFENDYELLPWDPAPEERVFKYGLSNTGNKTGLSILSLAHMKPPLAEKHECNLKRPAIRSSGSETNVGQTGGASPGTTLPEKHQYRKYLRNLLKAVSHYLLKLLGFEPCQNQRCLLYRQPFTPDRPLFLCVDCEIKFCRRMSCRQECRFFRVTPEIGKEAPPKPSVGRDDDDAKARVFAVHRYEQIQKVLQRSHKVLTPFQFQYRRHTEFERELEWLAYAQKVFKARQGEAHEFVDRDGKSRVKIRSLNRLLESVFLETPEIEILHRTLEPPMLKFSSLADMKELGPHQTPIAADGEAYAKAYYNRRHSTGGVYVEMGGNLNGKSVGNFPGIGINAVKMKSIDPLHSRPRKIN
ncbi:unnamed protein product [Amoebophrya sp. A25]|nr:unnamed protein product [Amoebophrya sp. A25]|eukprot:GSA25T00001865001.1